VRLHHLWNAWEKRRREGFDPPGWKGHEGQALEGLAARGSGYPRFFRDVDFHIATAATRIKAATQATTQG